jgi:four helix bundle protein
MAVLTYRDLLAWQRGIDFVEQVYRVTQQFPREERYGLTNQLRRAAVSIPSNIAEGQGRGTGDAFANHLRISQGSIQEAETQIIIADRLSLAAPVDLAGLLESAAEVGRLNRGLYQSIVPEAH